MKTKICIIIAVFLAGIYPCLSQTVYLEYTAQDKENIFSDDFFDNNYGWYTGTYDNCNIYIFQPGYYELQSLCAGQFTSTNFNTNNGFYIDTNRDFEIETAILFVSGEDNNLNSIRWGQDEAQLNRFAFGISGNGQYYIGKNVNNTWTDIKFWTVSSAIRSNEFNKLTIRKIGQSYFFFINENFEHTCPFEPFFGQQLVFTVNQNSVMRADFIRISYLNKQTDLSGPEISIYEPVVSRGIRIVESNKQVLVRGKASDDSGIYDVSINAIEAAVDNNGYFQQNIRLAVGDNTIVVKATDMHNNSSFYTFYINRESGTIYQEEETPLPVGKRLALIIGNSNYPSGQYLKNPVNDANLMVSTLQSLGFSIITRTDADKVSMEQAIREFSKKLPECDVALFYYAGHGVQVDGINYLIPTDAKLNEKGDCKFEAVSMNFVVEEFEQYPNNVNIVILDACRNNPFRSWGRGGVQGFKAIPPTSGTIISFATSEGSTASDGQGPNGLFTEELVKQMVVPQPIESVFKKTRVQVQRRSNGGQSPQEWSQLTGDFYFTR